MDPFTIASLGLGAFKAVQGIAQAHKANKLKPSTFVPPSLQANINDAEAQAQKTKYTGQDYDEQKVRTNTSNAINRAAQGTSSSANFLNFVGVAQGKENDAMNSIGQKAQQYQQMGRQNLQGLRGQRADVEQQNMNRYWGAKSALKGSSQQNIFGALNTGANTFAFNKMLGAGNGAGINNGQGSGDILGSSIQRNQNNPFTMGNYDFSGGIYG